MKGKFFKLGVFLLLVLGVFVGSAISYNTGVYAYWRGGYTYGEYVAAQRHRQCIISGNGWFVYNISSMNCNYLYKLF